NVVITISGTNDAPVITSAAQAGTVTELANASGSTAADSSSGTVSFTDLDLSDTHSTSFVAQGSSYLGSFSLDALSPDSTSGATGHLGWHFSVADGALDFLSAGESRVQTYAVTVDDQHGGTASQNVVITISGTNDAPVITSAAQAGTVTELANASGSTAADSSSGTVSFTDLDLSDTHSTSFVAQGSSYLGSFSLDALSPDSTSGATGHLGWHFSVADGALDFLAAGESRVQTYAVTVDDQHGGTASQN